MDRSKRFLVTTYREDLSEENIDEFMSRLYCKNYYAIFHPAKSVGCVNKHCHIYIEMYKKTDSFVVKDYFDRYATVYIPKDNVETMFAHLSHSGFYKILMNGKEID